MTKLFLKFFFLSSLIIVVALSFQARCAIGPEAYAQLCISFMSKMSDGNLVSKFKEEVKALAEQKDGDSDIMALEEMKITSLPIYRIPILKALISEILRRNRSIVAYADIDKAMKLIKTYEIKFKTRGV